MNPIARRLLVAAIRKLLPDAKPHYPGTALMHRPSDREIEVLSPVDRRSLLAPQSNSFLIDRSSQTFDVQPTPAPAPPPRRRRKVVRVTETYSHWKG